MKYKIIIAYQGTPFSGWQVQTNTTSIQEHLEQAFSKYLHETVKLYGAGRTDAGVHALGQVAHFSTERELDHIKCLLATNNLLPKEIRVKSIEPVDDDFHARYSAIKKEYQYHLHLSPVEDPFTREFHWHLRCPIDLNLMRECAEMFLGTHDFSSFSNQRGPNSPKPNPVRMIERLDIVPVAQGVRLEFESVSFLYKMIRNLTGAIVDVGKGHRTIKEIKSIFDSKNRRLAGPPAPARGLFLVRIDY